jgi:hypothetical protein
MINATPTVTEVPQPRRNGQADLTADEEKALVAFMKTLSDGFDRAAR